MVFGLDDGVSKFVWSTRGWVGKVYLIDYGGEGALLQLNHIKSNLSIHCMTIKKNRKILKSENQHFEKSQISKMEKCKKSRKFEKSKQ